MQLYLSLGLFVNAVTNKMLLRRSVTWLTADTHKVLLVVVGEEVLEPAGPVVPPPQ